MLDSENTSDKVLEHSGVFDTEVANIFLQVYVEQVWGFGQMKLCHCSGNVTENGLNELLDYLI